MYFNTDEIFNDIAAFNTDLKIPEGTHFLLGAGDPEMEAIESLLRSLKVPFTHATFEGRRVNGYTAYKAENPGVHYTHRVECEVAQGSLEGVILIDHHNPGDPGWGGKAEDYWISSSIGQVVNRLRIDLPWEAEDYLHLVAAGDHCPTQAYDGACPGIRPDDLLKFRMQSKAAFQRRSVEEIAEDVVRGRAMLKTLPRVDIGKGLYLTDARGVEVPELPEASARDNVPVIYKMALREKQGGNFKVGVLGGSLDAITQFMEVWAPANGIRDIYGSPERGYAGGYVDE